MIVNIYDTPFSFMRFKRSGLSSTTHYKKRIASNASIPSLYRLFSFLFKRSGLLSLILALTATTPLLAQEDQVQWLTFEQLEDSLAVNPKKVFIDFYADWCVYCKKMDQAAFKDPQIVAQLNTEYYAVKMDAETTDTIVFSGDTFVNKQLGNKRNPTHEIPLLLASRKGKPFSLPAVVLLDAQFAITQRHFTYLSPKKLNKILAKE